jgi:hypothetical protein
MCDSGVLLTGHRTNENGRLSAAVVAILTLTFSVPPAATAVKVISIGYFRNYHRHTDGVADRQHPHSSS